MYADRALFGLYARIWKSDTPIGVNWYVISWQFRREFGSREDERISAVMWRRQVSLMMRFGEVAETLGLL